MTPTDKELKLYLEPAPVRSETALERVWRKKSQLPRYNVHKLLHDLDAQAPYNQYEVARQAGEVTYTPYV